jgi:hypothetical protein
MVRSLYVGNHCSRAWDKEQNTTQIRKNKNNKLGKTFENETFYQQQHKSPTTKMMSYTTITYTVVTLLLSIFPQLSPRIKQLRKWLQAKRVILCNINKSEIFLCTLMVVYYDYKRGLSHPKWRAFFLSEYRQKLVLDRAAMISGDK